MAEPERAAILDHLEHIRGAVDHIDGKLSRFEYRVSGLELDFVALAKAEASRNIDIDAIAKKMAHLESRVKNLESQNRRAPNDPGDPGDKQRPKRSRKSDG